MTKRDVAVWFCRTVALQGIASAVVALFRTLITHRYIGITNFSYPVLTFSPILAVGLYLFIWFLARSIGTELAAEGEHGPPMTSGAEIGVLLLRCAGFGLFLSGSLSFAPTILNWIYEYFFGNRLSLTSVISRNLMLVNAATALLQSGFGFLLAFTPRLRVFFRS